MGSIEVLRKRLLWSKNEKKGSVISSVRFKRPFPSCQ